jgi:CTP:molybdopterin cytidylyltransferase MocA
LTDGADPTPDGVAGLILAAGAGTRYGQPKAPVLIDGERLVDRAVRNLREGGCTPVLVVLGAWIGDVPGGEVLENPEWREGMGSSLRAGLAALAERPGVDRVVVTLVDLPGLTGRAVRRVVACNSDIVVATYDGERGHPVAFSRTHWDAIREGAHGDQGARSFLLSRNDISLVEVGDVALGYDLDEPAE